MPEKEQREIIRELAIKKCLQIVRFEDRQNAVEAGFDPDECSESHLQGDCPLCGAK